MTKSESSTFPNRGTQHRIDTEVVQDLERQFRDAHKGDPDLWGQRFVDGSYLVRGSGRGRFHLLAAAGARAVGCAEEEEWIERLIQYLRDHDEDREYLKAQPAALYVNPKKTGRKPSSLPRDLSWDQVGATIGQDYTIHHLFKASADYCLWLIASQAKSGVVRRQRPDNSSIENVRALARQWRAQGDTHQEICQHLKGKARPPRAEWRHLTWDKAYLDQHYRGSVCKWLSKNCRP